MNLKKVLKKALGKNTKKNDSVQNQEEKKAEGRYRRRLAAAEIMRDTYDELGLKKRRDRVSEVIEDIKKMDIHDTEGLKEINTRLKELQNSALNQRLREKYIKEILPKVYNEEKQKPVEDKVLFLQPRAGLNLSCRYMYNTLKSQGKYKLRLHNMRRMVISNAEMYLNAEVFVRNMATAKAVFTHTFHDFYDYLDIREETKIIQLWHGCGIIKKLGISNADLPGRRTSTQFEEFNPYKNYDLVVMPSEEERWVFEDMMGLEPGDPVLQAIGVSRTDEFFDPAYRENCYRKMREAVPRSVDKKLILYAPTYRGPDNARYAPDQLDVAAFAEKLSEDYILIIKHHGTAKQFPEIPEEYKGTFAYDLTKHPDLDINEIMCVSDMIISDYSSVVFEFSLMERPIMFFMYDLEDYRDNRGMYYSYEEIAECGPIFRTNEEMVDYIANIDERFDKQKVIAFKNRFMSACDGHATERIIEFMES